MREIAETWFGRLARRSMLSRTLLLSGILIVLLFAFAPIVFWMFGSMGVISLSLVAFSTWMTGLACFVAADLVKGDNGPLFQMAFGMAIRMVVFMGLYFVSANRFPDLLAAGLVMNLLVFYMVGLAIETAVLVCNTSSGVQKV